MSAPPSVFVNAGVTRIGDLKHCPKCDSVNLKRWDEYEKRAAAKSKLIKCEFCGYETGETNLTGGAKEAAK